MVEHHVHDYAGDGNIQPDGQCPSRNFFMFDEVRSPRAKKGKQNQRNDDHRQNHVGNQYCEVKRSHYSLP